MSKSTQREMLLTDLLTGEQLAKVNRVLRWHGIREVGPCPLGTVLEGLVPMEMGRFCHILNELVVALDEMTFDRASRADLHG